jgi:CRP-like cAMP-binding protein
MLKQVSILQKPFDLDTLLENITSILDPKQANQTDKNKKKVSKGEILINAGEEAVEMYWVITGSFKAYKIENDAEVSLGTISAGELIGEMSFIDSQERSANIVALEDSEVLVIPPSKFTQVIEVQPQWFKNLVKNLSLRLRETNKKVHK